MIILKSWLKGLRGIHNISLLRRDIPVSYTHLLRLENTGKEAINFACFRFVETSDVTPSYEQSLSEYAEKGADYKTIWKLKDGGHYAKAGTRQLVYFGDNTITDFTLEVEIKLEGKTGTSTAGIVFHAKNYAASSYCLLYTSRCV